MTAGAENRSFAARLVREPVVVFAGIAALLFGLGWLFDVSGPERLTIDRAELDQWVAQAELSAGGALDSATRAVVEQAFIDQQVLAREARALGLDDDIGVDDLLAQRMLHVLSGDVIRPTEVELEAYLGDNAERYRTEPRMAVEEIVVSPRYNQEALPAPLVEGEDPADLLGGPLVSYRPMTVTAADLTLLFDPTFAGRVAAAAVGEWVGPDVSARGAHWVRIGERDEGRVPPLADVVEEVRLDWIAEQEEARLAESVAELRARYEIEVVPGAASGS